MTMKTKRNIAIGGGTALCAALAVLIAARFTPNNEHRSLSEPAPSQEVSESVDVTVTGNDETKFEITENSSADGTDETSENNDFSSNSLTEIEQNFPEPEKDSEPPAPPVISDEGTLTNPDAEPTYEPEQTAPQSNGGTLSDTPKHGDTKDGMIYIEGFGWVKDEGGGGVGYTDSEMYENGNKIGYFG